MSSPPASSGSNMNPHPERKEDEEADAFFSNQVCPCEDEIPEPQTGYEVPGEWITYTGEVDMSIFERAARSTDAYYNDPCNSLTSHEEDIDGIVIPDAESPDTETVEAGALDGEASDVGENIEMDNPENADANVQDADVRGDDDQATMTSGVTRTDTNIIVIEESDDDDEELPLSGAAAQEEAAKRSSPQSPDAFGSVAHSPGPQSPGIQYAAPLSPLPPTPEEQSPSVPSPASPAPAASSPAGQNEAAAVAKAGASQDQDETKAVATSAVKAASKKE